ncbi:MAG: fructokinase [Oleiphilaceae bacterium]
MLETDFFENKADKNGLFYWYQRGEKMNTVWLTGDAAVDLIPNESDGYLKCAGGAPANVAVAIARLKGESRFFGRVGNDPLGKFLKQTLESENVDVQHLMLDPLHRTSTVVVDLDKHGERNFTFMVKPSADQFIDVIDIPKFSQGNWLHCCSIALANEPSRTTTLTAMKSMKTAGGFISFDPNLRAELWTNSNEMKEQVLRAIAIVDVVKFSDDELLFLTDTDNLQAGLEVVATMQLPLVIVTMGADGALVVFDGKQKIIKGKVVKPIDTTGAGDAFVGGLLAKLSATNNWRQEKNILEAVKCGNACGAWATTKKGAMTALPTLTSIKMTS